MIYKFTNLFNRYRIPVLLLIVNCLLNAETVSNEISINGFKAEVRASSELASPKAPGMYSPIKAFDGILETAWVEGAPGTGDGEWIEVCFDSHVHIGKLELINGYRKNETLFKENGRAGIINLLFDGKESPLFSNISINSDTSIQVNRNLKSLRVHIVQVVKGSKYEDLCITEINPQVKPIDKSTIGDVVIFSDSTLIYTVSQKGIKVTSKEPPSKRVVVFDSTIRSFSSFVDARIDELKIPGLDKLRIFEVSVQHEYDRDQFFNVLNRSGVSALFFHSKSISTDGTTEYSLKLPVVSNNGEIVIEFTGKCTYPECDDFQKNIKFTYKNESFVKE